nr:restriction endonuclease subunit S [Rhodoferax sp.]
MSARGKVPFGDLLLDSKDGEWGEGAPGVGLVAADMIRGTDFAELNSSAKVLPRRYVNEKHAARKRLQLGDIVFEMAGGTAKQSTGRSALITKAFLDQRGDTTVLCASFCRHLRLDQSKYDPQYVFFVLQALYGAGYMAVFNIQHTGVSRFQYTSFKKHTVLEMPKLATQRKIAAILSAYDDLIANNQRRITLLERMAEDIYREWFVHLRFPGHQNVGRDRGIPAGWSVRSLGDVLELCYGKALKDEDRQSGTIPVYGSGGVVGTHSASLVDGPGIVVGRKGNVGSVFWSERAFFPIDTAYFVRSATSLYYLVFLLRSMNFINNDSAVPGLSRQQAYSNKLLFPPDRLIEDFTAKVKVLFDAKRVLSEQTAVLKTTRDALLPRLISGKLSVDALDIRFPPGMVEAG